MRPWVLIGFVFTIAIASAASAGPRYENRWGGTGSGSGQFAVAQFVALDSTGNVYVTDFDSHRIQKFDRNGTFLLSWGGYGGGDGQFQRPAGLALDDENNLYVSDFGNNRIQKFTTSGTFLAKFGGPGSAPGQLLAPAGLFFAPNVNSGALYVADSGNNRIQVFREDGLYLFGWGSEGSGDGQFQVPTDVELDVNLDVYVTDTFNDRVQRFSALGTFERKWGTSGSGDGEFSLPWGLDLDERGLIYVADYDNNRIQIFNSDGAFIDKFGAPGPNPGQINHPLDCVRDRSGRVFVVDESNHVTQFTSGPDFDIEEIAPQHSSVSQAYLAIGADGTRHVTFSSLNPSGHFYARSAGGPWIIEPIPVQYMAMEALALSPGGEPRVAYWNIIDGQRAVRYATRNAGTWTTELVSPDSTNILALRLAVDANDVPHMTWLPNWGNQQVRIVRYAARAGASWDVQLVSAASSPADLALDAGGTPHIAFYGYATQVAYGRWNGAGFSLETVVASNGTTPRLALGASGEPHLVYTGPPVNTLPQLHHASKPGGTWIVEPMGVSGWDPKIHIDAAGVLHVAVDGNDYSWGYPIARACYAHRSELGWANVWVLLDRFDPGVTLGIDVDPSRAASIVYQAGMPRRLMYARARYNTPFGSAVQVAPSSSARLTFANVTRPGTTVVHQSPSGPAAPAGLQIVPASSPLYYGVSTSAGFSGTVEVCLQYDPSDVQGSEENLQLLHYVEIPAPGHWELITSSLNTGANEICGSVDAFSPFAIAERNPTDALPTGVPRRFALYPVHPNPFNPTTSIRYDLPSRDRVQLSVLDVRGRRVKLLVDVPEVEAGSYVVQWDGCDGTGRRVSSGIYLCRLRTSAREATQRMILLK